MKRIAFVLAIILGLFIGSASARADYFVGAARQGAFTEVERVKGIQSQLGGAILAMPGVFGLGIGVDKTSGKLELIALTDVNKPLPALPPMLGGVRVVVVRDTPPDANNGGAACVPCHANQQVLPVQMGNSGRSVATGSNCGACTMGFKACDASTGNSVWVGASHCAADATTCPGTAPIGSTAYHVSPLDAAPSCSTTSSVGTVYRIAAPVANGTVDAVAILSPVTQTLSSIRDIGGPSNVGGTVLPGDAVQKSGRTTGLTTGVVNAVNVTIPVGYNCGAITLTQQIWIVDTVNNLWSQGGDSGSAVLNTASPPEVVGLSIAGNGTNGYANPIANVLGALGLTLDFNACAETACPALNVSEASSDPSESKSNLYRLRDNVLAESDLGRGWIHTFYSVSASWLALYATHPSLFIATKNSLDSNFNVLEAVARRHPVTITHAQLDAFSSLIGQHVSAAQDPALRAAFQQWRAAVNDPAVQSEFGVTVR